VRLFPRTLLWRTFLLLALLMLLSVLTWFGIYTFYEREPRATQAAQMVASVVNLTRAALVTADASKRRDFLLDLSDREGIRLYPVDPAEKLLPLPEQAVLRMIAGKVQQQIGAKTRFASERNGEPGFWVSFRLDTLDALDEGEDEYWIMLPAERLTRTFPAQWIGWGAAALLLSLAGAYLIVFRVTRPLAALATAAHDIGGGKTPSPLPEQGPSEIATVARAFNQMSHDLARLDADRALILAGISHDLRTPLTRLRLAIEMSGADSAAQDGMASDIEEMDKIIGQFLDFARETSGEPPQPCDLNALLTEIAAQYGKRGANIELDCATLPGLNARPLALRRLLTNLINNALRYAGSEQPITLRTQVADGSVLIEVMDRGPGIPADQVEQLKRPFTRLEAARTDVSGAGLGLAIVERIARAHGGTLSLLPRAGGGLAARVVIPLGHEEIGNHAG